MTLKKNLRALQLAVTECHAMVNNMYYRVSEIEVVITPSSPAHSFTGRTLRSRVAKGFSQGHMTKETVLPILT